MEFFPHECEFLEDGIVIMRFPDRLVPKNDIRYDYVSKYARVPLPIYPSWLELDVNMSENSSLVTPTDRAHFFRDIGNCRGCLNGAAQQFIDYVKVWDLPKETPVPNYPY